MGANNLFIPPEPLSEILVWENSIYMYTLNNIAQYCPSKTHTMIRIDGDNEYKACGFPKRLLHLLFSTGIITYIDMPSNIYSTRDLLTYLQFKKYIS